MVTKPSKFNLQSVVSDQSKVATVDGNVFGLHTGDKIYGGVTYNVTIKNLASCK